MRVQVSCNDGWVRKKRVLRQIVNPYGFMTWFWPARGGPIACTPEGIGKRRLEVTGLDEDAVVFVRSGRIAVK